MSARRRLSRMAIRGSTGHWREPNVNYVTKSGSNNFHGNALYWWNGRALNANSFFNNQNGAPRPFNNANQWAASFGGPIKKDKTFFFVDTEGLRFVLPTSTNARIPSPQFQSATLANLANASPALVPFYTPAQAQLVPVLGATYSPRHPPSVLLSLSPTLDRLLPRSIRALSGQFNC